jgi:tetratricopeptide (TPR) repeat protein
LQIGYTRTDTWNNKGLALYNLGKHEEAIKWYDKALEIEPNDDKAWYNKGLALDKLTKYEDARKCFDKAQQLREKNEGKKRLSL